MLGFRNNSRLGPMSAPRTLDAVFVVPPPRPTTSAFILFEARLLFTTLGDVIVLSDDPL